MTAPALELRDISKRFGNVRALEAVSFSARPGSIHALLGENGAGKTTLMRIAFGMIRPDAGWVATGGVRQNFGSPADAISAGVGMVHQQFSVVPAMTVAENVALGGRGRFDKEEVSGRIREIGERTGLVLDPSARVADLGSAERQKLEIVRTLAHDAKVLILDEPTAVLAHRDTVELFAQLRGFADRGGSVVLITHKLHDALGHSDEVTVLRRGGVALRSPMSGMTATALAHAMLGASVGSDPSERPASHPPDGIPVAVLEDVHTHGDRGARRAPCSLTIRRGEIVGVAALEGAGHSLLRVLAGREAARSGAVDIPADVGFVAENRQDEGIVADFTLTENLALHGAGTRSGLIDWSAMRSATARAIEEFDVVAGSSDVVARNLSGGNQQRFVLSRELGAGPPLLVLENPTQGLDVRAAAHVHERMRRARDEGAAVVFYSSDLDELAAVADRVLVVTAAGYEWSPPDRQAIGSLLLGTMPDEPEGQSVG